jgi:hypothetical protein
MKFDLYEFRHIVSNIGDLLFMSGSSHLVNISVENEDNTQDKVFMKLSFPLTNGNSEVRIYREQSFIFYKGLNGEILQKIDFNNNNIREVHGSFRIALKQILNFDRQNSAQTGRADNLIDRASFGLANIN